jgi:hypothetical protein
MRHVAPLLAVLALAGCFGGAKDDRAVGPPLPAQVNVSAHGCSYLFHDSSRYRTISGTWKGLRFEWDAHPQQHGRWSADQQRNVRDNARVRANGQLASTEFSTPPCVVTWNRLGSDAWQRGVATNFKVVQVASWEAIS